MRTWSGIGFVVTLVAAACGGKVRFAEDTSLDCDAVAFDLEQPTEVCAMGGVVPEAGPGTCSLFSVLPDGRGGEIRCAAEDGGRCELFLEGELACTCDDAQLDDANTCPNGVPTCSAWSINQGDTLECGL